MYFELWRGYGSNSWYLDRAYLSVFQVDPSTHTEVEIVCLHCDPNEPDHAEHALYKKGPHLHVRTADYPVSRAHIALNRGHLDAVLSSVDSLSEAMGLAVAMLKDEIMDAMEV